MSAQDAFDTELRRLHDTQKVVADNLAWLFCRQFSKHIGNTQPDVLHRERLADAIEEFLR